jgi:hypothetical protein
VKLTPNPTQGEIDALHGEYLRQLQALYTKHNEELEYHGAPMVIK